jgi:Flp pilus assembly protein TadB
MSHKKKHRQRLRNKIFKILSMFVCPFFVFFGVGELLQGSAFVGAAMIAVAAVLFIWSMSLRVSRRR